MSRLCERPGCSEIAALAYGMRIEDLVFWVDVLDAAASVDSGVLCQRHGDSMTVPRGWTLDDLRDPDLHLFRPPPRPDGPTNRRNRVRRRTGNDDETGQLALGGIVAELSRNDDDDIDPDVGANDLAADHLAATTTGIEPDAEPEPDVATRSGALDWKPAFDDGDDLDGLLAARGPLLSRAFRGERS